MTVLTVFFWRFWLPSFCLSYKIQYREATVAVLTVLTVSAVIAVSVMTATPLKINLLFPWSWVTRAGVLYVGHFLGAPREPWQLQPGGSQWKWLSGCARQVGAHIRPPILRCQPPFTAVPNGPGQKVPHGVLLTAFGHLARSAPNRRPG